MNEIIDNFKNILKFNFANFGGRARRSEFWLFHLVLQLLYFVMMIPMIFAITLVFISAVNQTSSAAFVVLMLVFILILLAFLALCIPALALTARRLHDTNRSGWWMLLGFIPFGTIIVLYFLVLDSDEGTNDFGEDPKEEDRNYYRSLAAQQPTTANANDQQGYVQNY